MARHRAIHALAHFSYGAGPLCDIAGHHLALEVALDAVNCRRCLRMLAITGGVPMRRDTRQRQRDLMAQKRAEGTCSRCPAPALDGQRRCAVHARAGREDVAMRRERRRAEGVCLLCPAERGPNRLHCERCLSRAREWQRRHRIAG